MLTWVIMMLLACGQMLVVGSASPFAQRWTSLAPVAAARVAGFAAQSCAERLGTPPARVTAAAVRAAVFDQLFPPGYQVDHPVTAPFCARMLRPEWVSWRYPGAVALMGLPLPSAYPGLPLGSQVSLWLFEFSGSYEFGPIGGFPVPFSTPGVPVFRAIYVVVNATTDKPIVAFAAAQRT